MYGKGSRQYRQITGVLSFAAVVVFANLHALQPLLPELSRLFVPDAATGQLELCYWYVDAWLVAAVLQRSVRRYWPARFTRFQSDRHDLQHFIADAG